MFLITVIVVSLILFTASVCGISFILLGKMEKIVGKQVILDNFIFTVMAALSANMITLAIFKVIVFLFTGTL